MLLPRPPGKQHAQSCSPPPKRRPPDGLAGPSDDAAMALVEATPALAVGADGRTPLHLSAAEGQKHVVDYFLRAGAKQSPVDRWGNTPIDDAKKSDHIEITELLERAALN